MTSDNDDSDDPPIYRPAQVAKEFGVSDRTVERWIRDGKLKPDVWTLGKHPRFKRSTLNRLHEQLRRECDPSQRARGGHWVMVSRLDPYPKPSSLTKFEIETALAHFWYNERRTGLISIEIYEADERKVRELIKEAIRAKNARRVASMKRFLHGRFGMTRIQLFNAVWAEPVTVVAKRFVMSDQALRKTCKRYKIPIPRRGYWRNKTAKRKTRIYLRPLLPKFP